MSVARGIFEFRRPLFEAGEPSSRVIRCLSDAKAYFERRPLSSLLDEVLEGRALARAAIGPSARLDHFGMLLPASCKELMSSAATAAGFPMAHAAFPSALFTRELGRLIGQRRLATSIFKAYGRTASGTDLATEVFFPQIDDAQVETWMQQGVGNHLAVCVESHPAFAAAVSAFRADGLCISPFMHDHALFLPTEEVSILYFDLEHADCSLRLEVRVAGDVTVAS